MIGQRPKRRKDFAGYGEADLRIHVVWNGSADGIQRMRSGFVTTAVLRGNQGNGVHDRILDAAQKSRRPFVPLCCVRILATVCIEYVFSNSSLVIGWKKLGFPVICWLKLVNWEMHKLLDFAGFQPIPAWKTLRKTGIGMRSSPTYHK